MIGDIYVYDQAIYMLNFNRAFRLFYISLPTSVPCRTLDTDVLGPVDFDGLMAARCNCTRCQRIFGTEEHHAAAKRR
jgi:hypothetical protein